MMDFIKAVLNFLGKIISETRDPTDFYDDD